MNRCRTESPLGTLWPNAPTDVMDLMDLMRFDRPFSSFTPVFREARISLEETVGRNVVGGSQGRSTGTGIGVLDDKRQESIRKTIIRYYLKCNRPTLSLCWSGMCKRTACRPGLTPPSN
ncbi:hypothetical protein SM11_pC1564 (plasmid) [Sinorhizobium meliloti SM11]|uniref:Uncharacterized protein n=1 Tax=Sinorhizobium meliloti (strain SM11) TaxID=707241 RepID=F7XCD1_SINMM|nr:hypothetical protein SM11_pC1564 [Sinorhizobium meliloti SM11]ARS67503.1 hypothetical protein SMRU11_10185 [Sinorhizobium meliloti RU11/001]ASP66500.1 hypothetical protein CDO29_17865 [Sinorhizobium meliloti]